jgi:hypothetical protein
VAVLLWVAGQIEYFFENAIIEEPTATTVIPAGHSCSVDELGNFWIVRNE